MSRRTIDSSDKPSVVKAAVTRNNGRYNGNGRHWRTPPEVFDPLNAEFSFTLDPCTTADNVRTPVFYTESDDGLLQEWGGHRVFLNPPYGREIAAWVQKARASVETRFPAEVVVALLPASTDLAWWHEHVVGRAEVRYIRGRVRFITGGPYRASGFFASVVVIWRAS